VKQNSTKLPNTSELFRKYTVPNDIDQLNIEAKMMNNGFLIQTSGNFKRHCIFPELRLILCLKNDFNVSGTSLATW
jgi:hypothetical protein